MPVQTLGLVAIKYGDASRQLVLCQPVDVDQEDLRQLTQAPGLLGDRGQVPRGQLGTCLALPRGRVPTFRNQTSQLPMIGPFKVLVVLAFHSGSGLHSSQLIRKMHIHLIHVRTPKFIGKWGMFQTEPFDDWRV